MLVRIFEGGSWGGARLLGDFTFTVPPGVGHRLVLAADGGWAVGTVREVAHRITDGDEAADVALLVDTMVRSDDRSDLPLAALDRLGGAGGAAVAAPRGAGPWR